MIEERIKTLAADNIITELAYEAGMPGWGEVTSVQELYYETGEGQDFGMEVWTTFSYSGPEGQTSSAQLPGAVAKNIARFVILNAGIPMP